jgi:hypothetical protein
MHTGKRHAHIHSHTHVLTQAEKLRQMADPEGKGLYSDFIAKSHRSLLEVRTLRVRVCACECMLHVLPFSARLS